MCGIAGIIPLQTGQIKDAGTLRQGLQCMTDALAHRGPDGEAHWTDDTRSVFLGHRRLAIIDITPAGVQPMHYADRYTIVHNGELYNYIELREVLKAKGYVFRSQSDTEVILAAYDHYGSGCLQHFDGMFAFAIWDKAERVLFAARDRLGEKPFFYTHHDNCFWFASEIKAFKAAGIPVNTRHNALLNFITPGLVQSATDASATFFTDIYSLPAAYYLTLNSGSGKFSFTRYWELPRATRGHEDETEIVEGFRHLLSRSVERRLRSDVPVGTSLSGGLDSSSIAALLHKNNIRLTTFSAVFPGFEKDESRWIQQITTAFDLEGFTTAPTGDELARDFEALCYHQEQPFGSASIYAQYRVYALAKQQGVTVLLDGQGADEVLGGYPRYGHWFLQELWRGDKAAFRRERAAMERNGIGPGWSVANLVAALFPGMASKGLQQRAWRQQQYNPDLSRDYFTAHRDRAGLQKPVIRGLNDILAYTTTHTGLQELLRYADRNSMAHGREVRLPFLSHELVEFVFGLPALFKIRDGFTKYLLRTAMQDLLPPEITWRKDKTGFEPPQVQWLQQPAMLEYIHAARQKLVQEKILNSSVLNKPIQVNAAHEAANSDWRYLVAAQTLL